MLAGHLLTNLNVLRLPHPPVSMEGTTSSQDRTQFGEEPSVLCLAPCKIEAFSNKCVLETKGV